MKTGICIYNKGMLGVQKIVSKMVSYNYKQSHANDIKSFLFIKYRVHSVWVV